MPGISLEIPLTLVISMFANLSSVSQAQTEQVDLLQGQFMEFLQNVKHSISHSGVLLHLLECALR